MNEENENPKVSVIIPTYNRADRVCEAIDSVLAQTFSDLEIIVVDDGSSDNTGQVLRECFGNRIRYYAQDNSGVSMARNRGISEARGEWIAFLDSDDLWEKDKLAWQIKGLNLFSEQCGACYTDVRLFNYPEKRTLFEMGEVGTRHEGTMGINNRVLEVLVRPGGPGMVVCPSSLVARTDLVRRTGGLDPNLKFQQDTQFMFRLALLTGFCYVNRPLVLFDRSPAEVRHVGTSKEWNQVEFVLRDSQIWLEGLLRLDGVPSKIRKLIEKQLAAVYSGLANWYLEIGEYRRARQYTAQAAQLDPNFNFRIKQLLTWISPRLALLTVQQYQRRKKESESAPFI